MAAGSAGEGQPPQLRQLIDQERILAYAQASGDHNPIHLDPQAALAAGLPSTIAHGLLTLGAVAARIEEWAGSDRFARRVSCRFAAPLASGSELISDPELVPGSEPLRVEFEARSGAGERVLSKGRVELQPTAAGEG